MLFKTWSDSNMWYSKQKVIKICGIKNIRLSKREAIKTWKTHSLIELLCCLFADHVQFVFHCIGHILTQHSGYSWLSSFNGEIGKIVQQLDQPTLSGVCHAARLSTHWLFFHSHMGKHFCRESVVFKEKRIYKFCPESKLIFC